MGEGGGGQASLAPRAPTGLLIRQDFEDASGSNCVKVLNMSESWPTQYIELAISEYGSIYLKSS